MKAGGIQGGKSMRQNWVLRYLVPLLGLVLLAVFAGLYVGHSGAYYRALNSIGVPAFTYPFIDWEFLEASIKCWREGIDVYVADPCDLLNRPYVYSPLFLRLAFIPTDRAWTMPVGLMIILAYLISLFWIIKPVNWRELIIFGLACASPMVIYGLERGNFDVLLFIMLVFAGVLISGGLVTRICSYALMLLAGLLKFYPVIALSTALRERPRIFAAVAVAASLICGVFLYDFRDELAAAWKNISGGGFSAANLPFHGPLRAKRLFPVIEQVSWFTSLPYAILAFLLIVTAFQVIHLARDRNLISAFVRIPERDAMFLVVGAVLITGCFFAGQSNVYRGVHLIFVIIGFVAMRRVTDARATRALLAQVIMIIICLEWTPLFNQILGSEQPGLGFGFYWVIREGLWWRLAAVLLAVLAIFAARLELLAALLHWRTLRARTQAR
jgi:hypothetical protein